MLIKRLKTVDGEITFLASADADFLLPIKLEAVSRLAKGLSVAGFRKGKVPLGIAEKNLDQRLLQSEVLDNALNELFFKIIDQQNIKPIGKPHIEIKKFVPFDTIECHFIVVVAPDFKLADYKHLKLKKTKVTITPDDINNVLNTLAARSAKKEPVERPAKSGDELIIDFEGTDLKGNAIPGAKGNDYPLTLGSNSFIPGFEANLIGLKSDQSKDFKIIFPKDYNPKTLANKEVKFSVSLKAVNEQNIPKIDDEFAKTVGPFENLEQLKTDIKVHLTKEREAANNHQLEEDVIKQIATNTKFSPPKSLVEDQLKRDLSTLKQNLVYQGQTFKEYLDAQNTTEDELTDKKLKPLAAQKVKGALVISAIAEKEGLGVSNQELENYVAELKNQYKSDPKMIEELDKQENRRELAGRLLSRKTLDKLLSYIS